MKNKIYKIVPVIAIISVFSTDSYAAGAMGGPGTGMGMGIPCGGPFPPCPVPLDSSVVLLLTAGAIYGAYKIYNSLKKNPA